VGLGEIMRSAPLVRLFEINKGKSWTTLIGLFTYKIA
jgi:hypothetical protein